MFRLKPHPRQTVAAVVKVCRLWLGRSGVEKCRVDHKIGSKTFTLPAIVPVCAISCSLCSVQGDGQAWPGQLLSSSRYKDRGINSELEKLSSDPARALLQENRTIVRMDPSW